MSALPTVTKPAAPRDADHGSRRECPACYGTDWCPGCDSNPQTAVDIWNNTVPPGTPVRYWTDEPEPKLGRTRSVASIYEGHAAVWVELEYADVHLMRLTHVTAHLGADGGAS